MKHVSVSPPPDELEHRLKDAYVRFADIDSRAVEAKKTCTAYISRVQPVIDCVKGHDVRWNVKVAQTLKSLGERRAEDLQKCKEQAAKEGEELLSRMRAKAEYDKLLTAKDVGSATFKDATWIEQRYAQTKVLVTEDVAAARSELEEFKTRKRALEEAVEVLPEIWFFGPRLWTAHGVLCRCA